MTHQDSRNTSRDTKNTSLSIMESLNEPSRPTLLRLSGAAIFAGTLISLLNWVFAAKLLPGGPILMGLGISAMALIPLQQLKMSAGLICGGVMLASLVGSYSTQGLMSIGWVGVPVAITTCGWLLGKWPALILTLASVAGVVVMYWLHGHGHSFESVQLIDVRAMLIISTTVMSWLFANIIADSFRRQWATLSQSQALLSSLFDSTDDLIWSVDPVHFGIMGFNTSAKNYFMEEHGIQLREGLRPEDLLPTEALIDTWQNFYRSALADPSKQVEMLPLGDFDQFQVRLNVMRRDNIVFGISVFAHNLIEEIRIEEKLEAEYEFQRNLIDSIPGILILLDDQERLMLWNRNLQTSLGLDSRQMSRLDPIQDVFAQEDTQPMQDALQKAMKTGAAEIEATIRDAEDQHPPYLLNIYPIQWGKRLSLLIIGIEITERKRLEQSWQTAKETAEQALSVRKRFLAHMSHELRTPMNAILGLSQFAQGESSVNVLQQYLEKIHYSASRLLTIINDILDFSKIEADGIVIKEIPFKLRELVDDVLTVSEFKAESKNLSLSCQLEQEIPNFLLGDPDRFRQILINLIDNAIKFTWQGGITLCLETEANDESEIVLICSIKDTGIGISPEDLGKLFQPFSQVDDANNRQYGGTGLGLAICADLVKRMGGTEITVDSSPDVGTTFSFSLPFKRITLEATQESGATLTELPSNKRLEGMRVLIVEDNPINQLVAKALVERLGGTTTLAEDGQQAVDILAIRAHDFDVVFMDIQMPVMDGHEATRQIRGKLGLTTLPIIAISAHAMESDQQQCLAEGMNACVTKPIDIALLVATLHRLVKVPGSGIPDSGAMTTTQQQNIQKIQADSVDRPISITPDDTSVAPTQPLQNEMDLPNALANLDGDESLYRELVELFIMENTQDSTRIRKFMADQAYPEAHRIAHTLKGLAATLSLAPLRQTTLAMDQAFKSRQYDQIETLTQQLDGELARTVEILRNFLKNGSA